jgi:hypothetical protein
VLTSQFWSVHSTIKLSKLYSIMWRRLLSKSTAIDKSARAGVMLIICTFFALCEQLTLISHGLFAVWFILLVLGRPKYVTRLRLSKLGAALFISHNLLENSLLRNSWEAAELTRGLHQPTICVHWANNWLTWGQQHPVSRSVTLRQGICCRRTVMAWMFTTSRSR